MYCVADPRKEKNRTPRMVKRTKPPEGWLELNTDGLVVRSTGLARGGGLIRDSRGHWIRDFAKACQVSLSIMAELWVLREGLTMCVELQARVAGVELDASAAISLVVSNAISNGDLSVFVDDCRDLLLLLLPQVKVFHCFREANFCAEALARLGSSRPDTDLILVSPPIIVPLFSFDLSGLHRPRMYSALADNSAG